MKMQRKLDWKDKYRWYLDKNERLKPSAPKNIKHQVTIYEFVEIHGDRYDYSLVKYENAKSKVKIICREHGEFSLSPNHHKRGVGCGKCAGFGFDTKKHIEDFKAIHGDNYDYSLVEYDTTDIPVKIICKEHGVFERTPDSHKQGGGCYKCSGRGLSTDEQIARYRKIHGNKYDYSLIGDIDKEDPVLIICPDHGLFSQAHSNHLRGHGCKKCAGEKLSIDKTLSSKSVISKFVQVHGDRYDYSKVIYTRSSTKVSIICPEHGEFKLTPSHHKKGIGCGKCSGYGFGTEKHVDDFKKAHGEKYDYSLVDYQSDATPVAIICPDHGVFYQLPTHHKRSVGCPACANRDHDALYIWTDKSGNHKIGITKFAKGLSRIYDCAKKRGTQACNIRLIKVNNAMKHEALLHKTFTLVPYTQGDGWTEFRTLTSEEYTEVHQYFDSVEWSLEF